MEMSKIAVVFPGMGYGKDKPLLYYAARQAKELGYEIRHVDYEGLPPMAGNTRRDKVEWTDRAYAKVVEQLADIDWTDKDIVFIAKSVGTVIASRYARANGLKPVMILLTPLNETFEFICDGRNFVFTGELDPWFDDMKLTDEIRGKIEEEFVYGETNHSLEGDSVDGDLETMRECIRHIRCVLTGEDW